MKHLSNSLEEAIEQDFQALAQHPTGEDRKELIEEIKTLYSLRMEEINNSEERYDSRYRNERDELFKCIRIGVDIFGITVPLLFYAIWMKKGLKFEETGTYTSQTFRDVRSFFRPKI